MKEYRKNVPLNHNTDHAWVELGPIPDMPPWHVQSKPSSYPFPTDDAARLFAKGSRELCPTRQILVILINGEEIVL